jgi:hypothetical protein
MGGGGESAEAVFRAMKSYPGGPRPRPHGGACFSLPHHIEAPLSCCVTFS